MAADDQAAIQRQWAVKLFNDTWTLIEKPDRTPDEDAAMVHGAHASCFHWLQVGAPVNAARGEWQCSRVYAVLGRAEPARYHAERCLQICEEHGIGDFDLAFAYEALARACAVQGDGDEARRYVERARAASEDIAEDEDRAGVLADLDTIRI